MREYPSPIASSRAKCAQPLARNRRRPARLMVGASETSSSMRDAGNTVLRIASAKSKSRHAPAAARRKTHGSRRRSSSLSIFTSPSLSSLSWIDASSRPADFPLRESPDSLRFTTAVSSRSCALGLRVRAPFPDADPDGIALSRSSSSLTLCFADERRLNALPCPPRARNNDVMPSDQRVDERRRLSAACSGCVSIAPTAGAALTRGDSRLADARQVSLARFSGHGLRSSDSEAG
mmetsp:Transcript_16043/g.38355  ORF Transcript_16043/g.38355 Transcript_16043/m.38355 type:complete len:235 (-) Transcript_16043:1107-1811(-)